MELQVRSLALLSGLRIQRCRRGLDPALLWLWCQLAAVALIEPLARELAYAEGAVIKRNKTKQQICILNFYSLLSFFSSQPLLLPLSVSPHLSHNSSHQHKRIFGTFKRKHLLNFIEQF